LGHRAGLARGAKKEPRRLERQTGMTLAEMLADLPTACAVGVKRTDRAYARVSNFICRFTRGVIDAKGHAAPWIGYKLHIDTGDGDIPISRLLTSASLHDSQAAIPLATITASRVTNLYDLMDSAYDAPEIRNKSRALGHAPIIDANPRPGGKAEAAAEAQAKRTAGYELAEYIRYNERSAAERVNGSVKENYGGRTIRVRSHAKVFCHLMFGILALTAEQLMRLVT
jgi:hypothetical protein